jgi:hypothetical protein
MVFVLCDNPRLTGTRRASVFAGCMLSPAAPAFELLKSADSDGWWADYATMTETLVPQVESDSQRIAGVDRAATFRRRPVAPRAGLGEPHSALIQAGASRALHECWI